MAPQSAAQSDSGFWQALFHQRSKELERACPIKCAIDGGGSVTGTPETFQELMGRMVNDYSQKPVSKGLQKISETLSHIKSFSGALSSFSQVDMAGMIIWGSLQIVIECVCRYSNDIEATLVLIADMNAALPIYDQALALHPNKKSLRFPLEDLFKEYVDCCLVIMKEFRQSPFKNIVRRIYSSRLRKSIERATKNIEKQEKLFFRAIKQADREAVFTQEALNTRALGQLRAAVMSNEASFLSTPGGPGLNGSSASKADEGTRPRLTTITARPNPYFVGREEETQSIHSYFTSRQEFRGQGPGCVVIHGLGGQGKTQTALHYYWRHRDAYDAAFLVKSETAQQLETGFWSIAKKLRAAGLLGSSLPPSPDTEVAWEVENARDWLEGTNKKWLLIFDNLEDGRLLETYIPENFHGGSILITTQHAHISAVTSNFFKLELQPLPITAGSSLLFKILEREPKDDEEKATADEICKWVGSLPLAIVTVSGYLKCSSSSATEILASLRRSSAVWQAGSQVGATHNYDKTLDTVFDLALGRLSEHSCHFLHILAFLSPDGIPEDMLRQPHTLPSLRFLNDEDEYLRVRQDLGLRQLIKRQPSSSKSHQLEIHRSLQMTLLLRLASKNPQPGLRTDIFSEVTAMLAAIVPQASRLAQNEKDLWPLFARYVPQVLALRQNSQWPSPPINSPDLTFAKLLVNIGNFLWHTGQIRECDSAMTTAEEVINMMRPSPAEEMKSNSECDGLISDMYLVTGIVADCIGVSRRKESLEHRQILLKLREKEFSMIPKERVTVEDEIRLGNAQGDLACAYLQRGEFGKAKAIMKTLYNECYKRWGTEDEYPYEYSKYYHHMGHILMAEGKPQMALELSRKGMELDKQHSGGVDSTVLIDQYDVACLLFNAGRVEESLKEHKEVLERRIQICGKSSQFVLESHEAVGILLHLTGLNANAEREFKTCLSRHYRANWTSEGVARAQYWYSRVLEALDKPEEAARERKSANLVKDKYLEEYPEFLKEDPDSEAAVFDQMVPMWILQTSGPLQEGGRGATAQPKEGD